MVDHLEYGRHAAPFLAQELRPGAVEFDLAGGVGSVAQLVLEALQEEPVARAIRSPSRQQEAGEPAGGLRQHEEGVAHRGRAEPLVPRQSPRLAVAHCTGGVGADVRSALLLGHRHPDERKGLARRGDRAGVVRASRDPRLPFAGELGRPPQRRHRRVGHRDGAAVALLALRVEEHQRGAGEVGVLALLLPGQPVDAVRHRDPHQLVP